MQDLGADSLDVVEIITSVEEEFDLVMPDEVLEQLNTVRDAVDYLASMGGVSTSECCSVQSC